MSQRLRGRRAEPGRGSDRRRSGLLLALLAFFSLASAAVAQTPPDKADQGHGHAVRPIKDRLRGGWYPWDPYQYQDYSRGVPVLTGFDVEIERALARTMGIEIALPRVSWDDHLANLAAGTADIASGATESEARARYAYFSKPYRTETDVLIVPRGMSGRYPFDTVDEMLGTFAREKFRLGVVAGFIYADSRVNAFIAKARENGQIIAVESDAQNLSNLLAGAIDGFLADRMTATTTAWRRHEGSRIEEHPLHFSTDIRFMLSRATQPPERLARLNDAIDTLKQSGELRRIAYTYALPVLINQTLDSEWFRVLSFIGLVAFALSGVVLAYGGNYTVFGAMILATLPAVGGGIVRDLLLQRSPLGIVRSPEALLAVFGTVLVGFLVIKVMSRIDAGLSPRYLQARTSGARLIEVFDAVGLAAFTVTGVVVALDAAVQPLWLWGPIAAVLTSSFGGLLRDLFRNDRVVANLSGELYPEIAAVWGLALALFLSWEAERLQPDEIWLGVVITILGAFAMRMVAITRRAKGWRYA